MIFAAKSLPLPNTSLTVVTISSACASSLAKINVFGTVVRPGKISVNNLSRKVSNTRRIWERAVTARSSWVLAYSRSSSSASRRWTRVRRSTFGTMVPASMVEPCWEISVLMRYRSKSTFTPSATDCG